MSDTENGLLVSADGGKVSITMDGNVEWTYTLDDKTWLTESKKTNTELEFTVKANDKAEVRKATATITSESLPGFSAKVEITQESGIFLNVPAAEKGLSVISDGAKVLITVQSNVEWTYMLDDDSWLTESKMGATELEFTAKKNEGWEERKATVTITSAVLPDFSAKVLITQASGAFLIVPAAEIGLTALSVGGDLSIGVESNMKWKYTLDDNTWLTETKKNDTELEFTATPNNTQKERKITVTITSDVLPSFSEKVVITQAAQPYLNVPAAEKGLSVVSTGGKIDIAVEGNVDWIYTLDDNSWLTESKKTNSQLELIAESNLLVEERTATVTITSASLPDFSAKVLIKQSSGGNANGSGSGEAPKLPVVKW